MNSKGFIIASYYYSLFQANTNTCIYIQNNNDIKPSWSELLTQDRLYISLHTSSSNEGLRGGDRCGCTQDGVILRFHCSDKKGSVNR